MRTVLALVVLGLAASAMPLLPSAAADCTYGSGPRCEGNCTINLSWCDYNGTCTVNDSGHCNADCTINIGTCGGCGFYQCYGACVVNLGACYDDCTVNAVGTCDGHCAVNAGYCLGECTVNVQTTCIVPAGARAAWAASSWSAAPRAAPVLP